MSSDNIINLVKKAQSGDVDSFGELYSVFATDMYRFALYQTSDKTLAEDAVGDAVLLAFKNIRQLKKPGAFKSWLFSILLNCCRSKQKEKMTFAKSEELFSCESIPATTGDYSENASLKAALSALDERDREIFLLFVLFGYTSGEIASMLNLKAGSVRSRLSRARTKMKEMIA